VYKGVCLKLTLMLTVTEANHGGLIAGQNRVTARCIVRLQKPQVILIGAFESVGGALGLLRVAQLLHDVLRAKG
jgi:hypothetical protein